MTRRAHGVATALAGVAIALMAIAPPASLAAGPDPAAARERMRVLIVTEARAMDFPAALALAVAHAESYFDPTAESHKGARGVMQIMPATSLGEYGIQPDRLWEPRINVRLGIHFLRRLIERYRGRTDLALSYYNGGSAVGNPPNARVIPATAAYVRKVRWLHRHYQRELWSGGFERWMRAKPLRTS